MFKNWESEIFCYCCHSSVTSFFLVPFKTLDQCLQICMFGELLTKDHLRRNWYNPCHTIHAMLFVSVQFWSCDILNQWEKNDYKVSINEISSLVLRLLHQSEMNKNFSLGNWNCDTSILHLLSFPSFLQTTMYNQLELCNMRVLQNSL